MEIIRQRTFVCPDCRSRWHFEKDEEMGKLHVKCKCGWKGHLDDALAMTDNEIKNMERTDY
jgi:hypothetical protein